VVKPFINSEKLPVRKTMTLSLVAMSSILFKTMMAAMGSMHAMRTVNVRANNAMRRWE